MKTSTAIMTTTKEEMAEDTPRKGGGSAGVGDMRRAALVIRCGDLDLHARIAADWSEGGRVESVEGGNQSYGRASR